MYPGKQIRLLQLRSNESGNNYALNRQLDSDALGCEQREKRFGAFDKRRVIDAQNWTTFAARVCLVETDFEAVNTQKVVDC